MAHLGVRLAGLELRNPVLSASGTFGHGLEMHLRFRNGATLDVVRSALETPRQAVSA